MPFLCLRVRTQLCCQDIEFCYSLGSHHTLKVELHYHIVCLCQLDKVVLKSLIEQEVIIPCQLIEQVEVALRAIVRDVFFLNEVTLSCHIADYCHFLTIQIQLDKVVCDTATGLTESFCGRFYNNRNTHLLALSVCTLLNMVGKSGRAVYTYGFACNEESCTYTLVKTIHQDSIIIDKVLRCKSKLYCQSVSLNRCRLERLMVEGCGNVLSYSQALLAKECSEARRAPV